ncbi:MAG: GNAT family N-acetyltransferase [Actinomycetota bacterium]
MTVEVRHAEPEDADAIAESHSAAWRVAYRGLVPKAFLESESVVSARRDAWHHRLTDGVRPDGFDVDDRLYVGLLHDRVVGFGHVGAARSEDPDDAPAVNSDPAELGELYGFYVHPAAWGTGIADRLIAQCHATLDDRFDAAVLWVLTDNPRARRFYERNEWSCDVDGRPVTALWPGPQAPGLPRLQTPIPEIRYHRRSPRALRAGR